jgi:hypothetical protein
MLVQIILTLDMPGKDRELEHSVLGVPFRTYKGVARPAWMLQLQEISKDKFSFQNVLPLSFA